MSLVDDFLSRYVREFDFYQEAARLCSQQCESALESSVRAIVTFRAKRPDRLRSKVEKRNKDGRYKTMEDVYTDLVDLSGVRIALYFPGDFDAVENIMNSKFSVQKVKKFPDEDWTPSYNKRFSGYGARHYRVRLKESELNEVQKRYADAVIEIQVASVLMHAWSEVEHDLVYKPLNGTLSEDEYAVLDELNGLVLAGEIALERLQRAAQNRLNADGKKFNNHYELAEYIYGKIHRKS